MAQERAMLWSLHAGAMSAAKALLVSQTSMLWSAIRRRPVWAPMVFTFFWSVSCFHELFSYSTPAFLRSSSLASCCRCFQHSLLQHCVMTQLKTLVRLKK